MNVISKHGLTQLTGKFPEAAEECDRWYRIARRATWTNLLEVQRVFPSADQVGSVVIFNIRHNRYRLITFMVYGEQKLYVKALLTHKEYERKEWMKWA